MFLSEIQGECRVKSILPNFLFNQKFEFFSSNTEFFFSGPLRYVRCRLKSVEQRNIYNVDIGINRYLPILTCKFTHSISYIFTFRSISSFQFGKILFDVDRKSQYSLRMFMLLCISKFQAYENNIKIRFILNLIIE